MKTYILTLALLISGSVLAQNITSVPFYFSMTEEAHLPLADRSWRKIPVKGIQSDKAYLRGYTFVDPFVMKTDAEGMAKTDLTDRATVESKRAYRREIMKLLLAKNIIQTGDVVLSFRPAWESTIPYAHIQMGISHSSLAYVDNGVLKNLDMPLDSEYNGENVTSGYDSNHYIETNHLQILRPRNFSAVQKSNILNWIKELRKNYLSIRAKNLLRFNSDYSAPKIDKYSPGDSFITTMARIMKGLDQTSTNLTMFCSEYAWSMLALSNCSVNDPQFDDPSVSDVRCIKPIFSAMNLTTLTEGPLAVLKELDISSSQKTDLMKILFTQGTMTGLSSGHRALAANKQVIALMQALTSIYPAELNGQGTSVAQMTSAINAQGGRNYSPTSFMINAMLDQRDPERKFDYVATLIFTPKL